MHMLTKIFTNPIQKLRGLLKVLFGCIIMAGNTWIIVTSVIKIMNLLHISQIEKLILTILTLIVGPVLFSLVTYTVFLLTFCLIDFFIDVHTIAKSNR